MLATGQFTISQISDGADGITFYTWIRYADSPTSGMSESPSGKKYLGVAYNKTSATPSTNYSDYKWSLIEGDGIASVTEEHAKSTSKTTAPTSGWTTDNIAWTSGSYLWTRLHIVYTSDKEVYTTAVCDSSWEAVDNIEIGGRNLARKSDTFNVGSCSTGITSEVQSDGSLKIVTTSSNGNWHSSWYKTLDGIEESFNEGDMVTISFTIKSDDCTVAPNIYLKNSMVYWNLKGTVGTSYSVVYCTRPWSKSGTLQPHLGWGYTSGTYYIKNWKIEKGNKPTDWTPAPEDVQSQIDTITSTVSGVSSQVDSNTKSITNKVWQTDITTSINNYDTCDGVQTKTIRDRVTQTETDIIGITTRVSNAETTLSQKADGSTVESLTTRVSMLEETDTEIKASVTNNYNTLNTKIDGIEIGGRNLLLNSDDLSKWINTNGSATLQDDGYYKVLYTGTGWWGSRQLVTLEAGQTYTLSGWGKGTKAQLAIYNSNGTDLHSTVNSTTESKLLTLTFSVGTTADYHIICYADSSSENYYKNIKLEKGNKATDWSPSPEDVDSSISSLAERVSSAEIKITDSVIVSTVTSSETYKNNLGEKVSATELISKINQSAESVTIEASKINLAGAVTISSLSSDALNTIKGYSTEAVDNIEIGGRNLARKSDTFNVGSCSTGITSEVQSDGSLKIVTTSSNGNWHSSWYKTLDGIEESFNEGDMVTISFTIKSDDCTVAPNIYLKNSMVYWNLKGTVGTSYSVVYCTRPWSKSGTLQPHLGWGYTSGTYYIKNWKIEKGNKPTSWTPAPEDVDSLISANSIANWCYNNNTTYIDGSKLYTGTVTSKALSTDAIKSNNYVANSDTASPYSSTGTFLDLANGNFYTPNFGIDNSNNKAYFGGELIGASGTFGGSIVASKIAIATGVDSETASCGIFGTETDISIQTYDSANGRKATVELNGLNINVNAYGSITLMADAGDIYLNSGGDVNINNYTALHTGNYSSYCAKASHTHSYLPLSGGTLTNNITIKNSSKAICKVSNANNSVELHTNNNAGVYHSSDAGDSTEKWLIYISTAGTVTANTSDRRWKVDKGFLNEDEAITILRDTSIVNFVYKEDIGYHDLEQSGIYAQDLRDVLLRNNYKNRGYIGVATDGTSDISYDITLPEERHRYEVDYSKFIPVLWRGWQSHDTELATMSQKQDTQQARIETLQYQLEQAFERISKLEGENKALKALS